jgi:hypothetical protein
LSPSRPLVAATMLLAACGDQAARRTQAIDTTLPIVAARDTGTNDDCPVTGLWSQCLLLKRIERMGLTFHVESLSQTTEPHLSIAGRRMPIAHGDISYFIYADTGSRVRDAAKLDSSAFISPSRETGIRDRTLIANENLLVIMRVFNGANRERLANAIMGGPPQPVRQRR